MGNRRPTFRELIIETGHRMTDAGALPVPPIIPAAIRLARAREEALAVQRRVEVTPLWDETVKSQGWNPRS